MNRAILIVICDFLVSAMLSMMTGMVPAHTGGTGVGLDEQTTKALLAEMHENMSQLERLRELLRENIRKNGGATPEELQQLRELARQIIALRRDAELLKNARENKKLANLSAKELRKRLEAELRERKLAEMELQERNRDLAQREKDMRDLRDNSQSALASQMKINENLSRSNTELARQNAETSRKLEQSRDELRSTEKALGEEKSRREVAETRLRDTRDDLTKTRSDLSKTKGDLRNLGEQSARNKAEAEKQRALVRAARQELNKREKELATKRDEENRLKREKEQLKVENAKQKTALEEQRRVVKNSLTAVRKAREDLEKERIKLAKAEAQVKAKDETIKAKDATIKVAAAQLKEANRKLHNRVHQSYGGGIVKLTVDIREMRMLRELRGGGTFYLPLVRIDGRTFLVGHQDQFIGARGKNALTYRAVNTATLFAAVPNAKKPTGTAIKKPVHLANAEPLLAAVEMDLPGRKPLPALTVEKLRERGVEDLYLFKAGSYGRENTELTGRCSLGPEGELFIRNSGSRSELRAEPGDLILTRSGEFAGIVIAAENPSGSSRRGDQARAFVLPNGKIWDNPEFIIRYTRPEGEKYFTDFEDSVRRIREKSELKSAPSRRRRAH